MDFGQLWRDFDQCCAKLVDPGSANLDECRRQHFSAAQVGLCCGCQIHRGCSRCPRGVGKTSVPTPKGGVAQKSGRVRPHRSRTSEAGSAQDSLIFASTNADCIDSRPNPSQMSRPYPNLAEDTSPPKTKGGKPERNGCNRGPKLATLGGCTLFVKSGGDVPAIRPRCARSPHKRARSRHRRNSDDSRSKQARLSAELAQMSVQHRPAGRGDVSGT